MNQEVLEADLLGDIERAIGQMDEGARRRAFAWLADKYADLLQIEYPYVPPPAWDTSAPIDTSRGGIFEGPGDDTLASERTDVEEAFRAAEQVVREQTRLQAEAARAEEEPSPADERPTA